MHYVLTKIDVQRSVCVNCSGTSQSQIEGVGSSVDGCLRGPAGVLTRSAARPDSRSVSLHLFLRGDAPFIWGRDKNKTLCALLTLY